eukprot:5695055-Prymnesium_polylepis.1
MHPNTARAACPCHTVAGATTHALMETGDGGDDDAASMTSDAAACETSTSGSRVTRAIGDINAKRAAQAAKRAAREAAEQHGGAANEEDE